MLESVPPSGYYESEKPDSERADELKEILSLALSPIPEMAGNGQTLKFALELDQYKHPVWTIQEEMPCRPDPLKALIIDLANHTQIRLSSGHDLCQSIEQSLHIIHARSVSALPGTARYMEGVYTRQLAAYAASRLAQDGKPVSPFFNRTDIDLIDPYTGLIPPA